jgi:hypothetical protein
MPSHVIIACGLDVGFLVAGNSIIETQVSVCVKEDVLIIWEIGSWVS